MGRVEGGRLIRDGGVMVVSFSVEEARVSPLEGKIKADLGTAENIVLCDNSGNRHLDVPGTQSKSYSVWIHSDLKLKIITVVRLVFCSPVCFKAMCLVF